VRDGGYLWIEPEVEEKIMQPGRRISRGEVDEVACSVDDSARGWGWSDHPDHGWRLLGVGNTRRERRIMLIAIPLDAEGFSRAVWADWYEEWDGEWELVTAFPV
jgi:hypothetical protein